MKPPSMSMKDWLVQGMEASMGYDPGVVEKVINFQGEDMLKAVKLHNEVEISGIGIIYVSKTKLATRIKEKEKSLITWQERLETDPSVQSKLDNAIVKLEFLKGKQCQDSANT